jgi:hypothetical protein
MFTFSLNILNFVISGLTIRAFRVLLLELVTNMYGCLFDSKNYYNKIPNLQLLNNLEQKVFYLLNSEDNIILNSVGKFIKHNMEPTQAIQVVSFCSTMNAM